MAPHGDLIDAVFVGVIENLASWPPDRRHGGEFDVVRTSDLRRVFVYRPARRCALSDQSSGVGRPLVSATKIESTGSLTYIVVIDAVGKFSTAYRNARSASGVSSSGTRIVSGMAEGTVLSLASVLDVLVAVGRGVCTRPGLGDARAGRCRRPLDGRPRGDANYPSMGESSVRIPSPAHLIRSHRERTARLLFAY